MLTNNIQHIFFDLDHTLWDFNSNAQETLEHLFDSHEIHQCGIPNKNEFIDLYHLHNDILWEDYRNGTITKEVLRIERFKRMFTGFDSPGEPFFNQLADEYLELCSNKTGLIDHAIQSLDYLKGRYQMHIITNGFEEVQFHKLSNSGLHDYFSEIITSEQAGYRKPNIKIFKFAEKLTGAKASNSIMIGDNLEVDVEGAQNAGWSSVHFDPKQKSPRSLGGNFIIGHLSELKEIL